MRWDIINYLIINNNYKSYLEIGVQDYYSNFALIEVPEKVCIDPSPKSLCDFIGTSDEYFESINQDVMFDIIFIDGLHHSEQVLRDIENSLNHLNPGGSIVVHDCLPLYEMNQVRDDHGGSWTGDVWKAMVFLKGTREDLDIKVVDDDWGCGIIKRGKQSLGKYNTIEQLNWKIFEKESRDILSVITIEEFRNLYKNASI